MPYRIRINQRHTLDCPGSKTILEAAREAGFGFPHACRNGVCRRCEGRLGRGSVLLTRPGGPLSAGESGADAVLYCVAFPISDCEIDVPDITAPGEIPEQTLRCQIRQREPLNHDVSRIWLRLPAGRQAHWYAGQYLILDLPHGQYPFSIANAPGSRELELHIRHGHDNPGARRIMADLADASTVSVILPQGLRYLDTPPPRPLWFICGSTGFAPVKAMIERLIQIGFEHPVRLFWGARTEQDLYLPDLPSQWQDALPDFHAVTALSDISKPGHAQGLVHEAALEALEQPEQPLFYIGGSPAMVWAVHDALVEEGVPASNMHSDVFDYAPRD
ncbi:MAG: 2Fe-2S iron-sulfur cluster binding domain-containing protein [Alcanivorax sp.]|nr:2Fe-2S iron-sulfur cluster binding domain-containing protein [Alcanivorax sp.]